MEWPDRSAKPAPVRIPQYFSKMNPFLSLFSVRRNRRPGITTWRIMFAFDPVVEEHGIFHQYIAQEVGTGRRRLELGRLDRHGCGGHRRLVEGVEFTTEDDEFTAGNYFEKVHQLQASNRILQPIEN